MNTLGKYHRIVIILIYSRIQETLLRLEMEATEDPFSYLFINLTQECQPQVKYLSKLFDYIFESESFVKSLIKMFEKPRLLKEVRN